MIATEDALRIDVACLRKALERSNDANDALRRENDRLRRVLKLVAAETERHRLTVETAVREVLR